MDSIVPAEDASALVAQGVALADAGAWQDALAPLRRAAMLAPDRPEPWTNLGAILSALGRSTEAQEAHDAALARAPADPRIRLNRAVALLRHGHWREAWPEFEARLELAPRRLPHHRLLPDLTDGARLDGRTVLVWHDEGFGDTIQFARYLPLLAGRGARVLVVVPEPLRRLLAQLPGIEVLDGATDHASFHLHCPFTSLPRVFGTTPDTVPPPARFASPPGEAAAWRARLGAKMLLGLCWAGQARPWAEGFDGVNARRTLPGDQLAPLAAVPGVCAVGLHPGLAPPFPGVAPLPAGADFARTAGLVAALDLVISVDTAVAHLAGSLGVPVLLANRFDSCWRWLPPRADTPWYPTMRILRQDRPGDWRGVLNAAAAEVAGRAAA